MTAFQNRKCLGFSRNRRQIRKLWYVIYKTAIFPQVFEEDALQWEEKLNRIHDVFDVWIDVQRRWVYLDGIFSGSADIKALLPVETQRFQRWVFLFYGIGMNVIAIS